jgi:hypothetical protein
MALWRQLPSGAFPPCVPVRWIKSYRWPRSVAGIEFQLEAIRIAVLEDLPKVRRQLNLASELVRHSHAKARRSIDTVRPQRLESEGLLECADSLCPAIDRRRGGAGRESVGRRCAPASFTCCRYAVSRRAGGTCKCCAPCASEHNHHQA